MESTNSDLAQKKEQETIIMADNVPQIIEDER
jgi:hypothetical protein